MIWKKLTFLSFGLWALSVGAFLYMFIVGTGTKVDNRTEILLLPSERELVLGEMRQLLEGVRGIIGGVAAEDKSVIASSARAVGMQMAVDVNPALMAKLPKAFKELGMGTHRRFDELADRVHSLSGKEVLQETHAIMGSCIGCHVTYKINEARTKASSPTF